MIKLVLGILIGVPGLVLMIFTVQNYMYSMSELEPNAANMFLLVTGLPSLILVLMGFVLIRSYLKGPKLPSVTVGHFCHACGTGLAEEATFCQQCGVQLD